MIHKNSIPGRRSLALCLLAATICLTSFLAAPSLADAQSPYQGGFFGSPVYNGGGIEAGVLASGFIFGIGENCYGRQCLRNKIASIVNTALSFAALIAVSVLVIAGFYLLLGLGSDTSRDKAKNIIIFTAIGLLILILAKVIVFFFILLPQ